MMRTYNARLLACVVRAGGQLLGLLCADRPWPSYLGRRWMAPVSPRRVRPANKAVAYRSVSSQWRLHSAHQPHADCRQTGATDRPASFTSFHTYTHTRAHVPL